MSALEHALLVVAIRDHLSPELLEVLLDTVRKTVLELAPLAAQAHERLLAKRLLVHGAKVLVAQPFRLLLRRRLEIRAIREEGSSGSGQLLELHPGRRQSLSDQKCKGWGGNT